MRTKETSLNNSPKEASHPKPLLTIKSALKAGDAYQDGFDHGSSLSPQDYETIGYHYGVVDGYNAMQSCSLLAQG